MAVEQQRWADSETLARLSAYPCLRCLSDKELWVGTVMLLCQILETDPTAECTVESLVARSACTDCFSDRQLWQMLVALIAEWAVAQGYVESVDAWVQDASCLSCLSEKQVKAIVVSLLARGLEDGTLFPAHQ